MAQQRIHSRLPAAEVLRGQSGGTVGRVGGNPSLTKLARRMISHASTCQLDCKLAAGLQPSGSQCSCSASGNSGTGKDPRGVHTWKTSCGARPPPRPSTVSRKRRPAAGRRGAGWLPPPCSSCLPALPPCDVCGTQNVVGCSADLAPRAHLSPPPPARCPAPPPQTPQTRQPTAPRPTCTSSSCMVGRLVSEWAGSGTGSPGSQPYRLTSAAPAGWPQMIRRAAIPALHRPHPAHPCHTQACTFAHPAE